LHCTILRNLLPAILAPCGVFCGDWVNHRRLLRSTQQPDAAVLSVNAMHGPADLSVTTDVDPSRGEDYGGVAAGVVRGWRRIGSAG
jgi:hypothetical protein